MNVVADFLCDDSSRGFFPLFFYNSFGFSFSLWINIFLGRKNETKYVSFKRLSAFVIVILNQTNIFFRLFPSLSLYNAQFSSQFNDWLISFLSFKNFMIYRFQHHRNFIAISMEMTRENYKLSFLVLCLNFLKD